MTINGHKDIIWSDGNVLYPDGRGGRETQYICQNVRGCTLKIVEFYCKEVIFQ